MFDITKRTTITTDWAQLKTVQEQMNLAEIMLEVGSEFPICLEADADNENDVFEQLTAQVVHVTKEGRVMVVLKDCMEKMRAMNDHATNKGGWKDSAMRKWLNEDVLPRLPKELQAMIVPRTIRQKINGEEVQTQDKLWLPSFTEMFGAKAAAEWAPGDLGDEQFELFDSERSRVKEVPGRGTWWYWLRSPNGSYSTYFCDVNSNGDAYYSDFIEKGYLKEALVNYIVLLGWNPGDDREFFTLEELVEAFDLKGLSKAPAIFNTEKLVWFNHEYIARMPFEDYLAMVTPWFDRALAGKNIDYRRLAELMHTRTEVFDRVPDMVRFLAELPPYSLELYTHKKMKTDGAVALRALELARPALWALEDFGEDAVKDCLMALAAQNGLKTGQMMWPVRVALSGQASTPGGATEIAYLLGKDESLRRVDIALERLRTAPESVSSNSPS